jgi:large subunit ribosomal protein L9
MMQIILKEDVHNLGKAGEVVTVRPGYGRNFLIPQGKAAMATARNVAEIEHQKKIIAAKNAKLLKDSQAIADRIAQIEIQIERAVGEEDRLFGSVTSRDIEEALAKKGVTVDHKKLHIGEMIKTIGIHNVEAKLGQGVTATVKVVVVPKSA